MNDYQQEFIQFALECDVLRFGRFTLKSGRESPYFFNTGLFDSGAKLARLGRYYAAATVAHNIPFDMVYGPAYKGIPLASATAIALADRHGRDVPYCFNRKERKTHGEGGMTLGAPLKGRVLIIDDVISAGTSVKESIDIITAAGAMPAAVLIALNRQERGSGRTSAIQEVEGRYGIRVYSIICLADLIGYLAAKPDSRALLEEIEAYRARYGESD